MLASHCCPIKLSVGIEPLKGTSSCDDGSDDSVSSPKKGQDVGFKGIARFWENLTVTLQVTLTSKIDSEAITLSPYGKLLSLYLSSQLDDYLLIKNHFLLQTQIWRVKMFSLVFFVLKQFRIDYQTLLETKIPSYNKMDFSPVEIASTASSCGFLARLMISRLQGVNESKLISSLNSQRPHIVYFMHKCDVDPLSNPDLLAETNQKEIEFVLKIFWLC